MKCQQHATVWRTSKIMIMELDIKWKVVPGAPNRVNTTCFTHGTVK